MSETFIRISVRRPHVSWPNPLPVMRDWWLDAYPHESGHAPASGIPVRIDAAVVRSSSVTHLSWLRPEFRNMEIEGPNVQSSADIQGVLGNRARRGPRMRADDAVARFGDHPADNMIVIVRGRNDNTPKLNNYWGADVEVIKIYEMDRSSNAVRRAFEILAPTQLHRDSVMRQPVPGATRTQEQLVFGFAPASFRHVTDFDEMRLGSLLPGVP